MPPRRANIGRNTQNARQIRTAQSQQTPEKHAQQNEQYRTRMSQALSNVSQSQRGMVTLWSEAKHRLTV